MTDLETTAHAIYVAYHTALGRPVKAWAALTDADRARHRQRAEAFLTPGNARKSLPERLYLAWHVNHYARSWQQVSWSHWIWRQAALNFRLLMNGRIAA